MRREDQHRIRHILDAVRTARGFVADKRREDLDTDLMLALAVVKCVEIIGEAAANLSQEGKDAYPTIPWRSIVAMRNRLIHAYFDVNLDLVWDTTQVDLPALLEALEADVEEVE